MRERSDSERKAITNLKLTSRRPTRGAGRLARNPAAPRALGAATTGRSGHPELGLDRQRCHDSSSTAIHTKKSAIFPPSSPHFILPPPPFRTHICPPPPPHTHTGTPSHDCQRRSGDAAAAAFHEFSACSVARASDVDSPLALGEAASISPTETRDTRFRGRYFVMLTVYGFRSHPPALGCLRPAVQTFPGPAPASAGQRAPRPTVNVSRFLRFGRPATTWPAGPLRPDPVAGSPTQTQVRVGRFGEFGRGGGCSESDQLPSQTV